MLEEDNPGNDYN